MNAALSSGSSRLSAWSTNVKCDRLEQSKLHRNLPIISVLSLEDGKRQAKPPMLSTVSGPLLLAFLLGWLVVVSTGEQCLPYAIPPAERRSLQSDTGTFPLGLWVNGNSHDVGVSAAFSILVEEIVGIHVFTDPRRPKNVKHAFYAIAGCEENATSGWVCGGKESRIHVMLSAYMLDNEDELAAVNRMRMGGIISVLGSVGYSLFEGLHVSQSLIAKAWETQGLALEYYRSYHYNQNPSATFNKISEVNTSDLVPCAEWGIYSPHVLDMYLKLTGLLVMQPFVLKSFLACACPPL